MIIKKGAMFGLDARIALAIFGALSVISGAALYSAIQTVKLEQFKQFFLELEKASEAYYLDVGSPIDQGNGVTGSISCLIENCTGSVSWNGPYISGEVSSSSYIYQTFIKNTIAGSATIYMSLAEKEHYYTTCSVDDTNCYEYYGVKYVGNTTDDGFINIMSIFNIMDTAIDSGDGSSNGKIQLKSGGSGSSTNRTILYRSNIPRVRS